MNNNLSIDIEKQLKAIRSHKKSRTKLKTHNWPEPPPPAQLQARLGLTQEAFAALMGVSVKTLRNWEQGQRSPTGPALALLRLIDRHPEVLFT